MVKKFSMTLILLFLFLPFIPLVIWSFTKHWPWPLLLPEKWSMDSWNYIFSGSGMAKEGLINSLLVAGLTLMGNLLLGIPAAKILAHREFAGKKAVFILLLSPLFVPFTVSIIGMHHLALQVDFLNDYFAVAFAHLIVTLPYFMATVWFQYRLIGMNLQEAAFSLGAGKWNVFWLIEMPLILPSLLLGSLLVIIISLSQYLPTWIMSGGTLLTLPLVIFPFASSGDSSIVSAYSLVFFAPIFVLLMIYGILVRLNKRVKLEGSGHASEEDLHAASSKERH